MRYLRVSTYWVYSLELYELVSLVAATVTLTVFFVNAKRLQQIIGVDAGPWALENDLLGIYQHWVSWLFTSLLTLLVLSLIWLTRSSIGVSQRHLPTLVRLVLTFCLMIVIYRVVVDYIAVFIPHDRDMALGHIDRRLFFGKLPAQWLEDYVSRPLTVFFSGAYVAWFALTYLTVVLMLRRSRYAMAEYVFTTILTFYIGYLTYTLVPAIGPLFTVPFRRNLGGIGTVFTANQPLIARDCFPSLHTAIALVMLSSVARHQRPWVWVYAPAAVSIIVSTLYLRFHYGVDDIAGAALAGVTCQVCPVLMKLWEQLRRRNGPSQSETEFARQSVNDGTQNVTA